MKDINLQDIAIFIVGTCFVILMICATILIIAWILPGFQQLAQGKPFFLSEYESRNRIVQECLAAEQYTRDECIRLAARK